MRNLLQKIGQGIPFQHFFGSPFFTITFMRLICRSWKGLYGGVVRCFGWTLLLTFVWIPYILLKQLGDHGVPNEEGIYLCLFLGCDGIQFCTTTIHIKGVKLCKKNTCPHSKWHNILKLEYFLLYYFPKLFIPIA